MKYYSEALKKLFDSEQELKTAEKETALAEAKKKELEEAKKQERAKDAEEVQNAFKKVKEAEDEYREKLQAFIKKHGYYHYSTNDVKDFPSMFSLFEPLFTKWF